MNTTKPRILVTGGGTFLGDNIAAALLAEGVEVTLLVRPGTEERLGGLGQRVRWFAADVWNPASMRGRARGHTSVIHTVGSMVEDPSQGLNHHYLNFVSARNVANLCISDGVPHITLISGASSLWVARAYIKAKRDAELYIGRVGLQASIIRAPITYVRGAPRHPFFRLISLLGVIPPISWLGMNRVAPIPVDVLARGVARITIERKRDKIMFYAPDLRRRNTRQELRQGVSVRAPRNTAVPEPEIPAHPFLALDEDVPFGWSPLDDEN